MFASMAERRKPQQSQAADQKKAGVTRDSKSNPGEQAKEITTIFDSNWSWSDFSSWPLSVKFFPVFIAGIAVFIGIYYQNVFRFDAECRKCASAFDYGFNIDKVQYQAEYLPSHDWEAGTAAEGLLELLTPRKAVFGSNPFPKNKIPNQGFITDRALVYVHHKTRLTGPTLSDNDWGVSDPAALGVYAVMSGQQWVGRSAAAEKQKDYLLKDAPRYENGAISHRIEFAELWSDAISMFPPFLAYYAVGTKDMDLMKEAVRQCELYRDVLVIQSGPKKGLWRHVVGPSDQADDGAWSTGNAWAAYGMARVRATIAGWRPSNATMQKEIRALDGYIAEILDGAITTDDDESGLLRNYLGDDSWFAETSGTTLLAAAAYRLGMNVGPSPEGSKYLNWAHAKRQAVTARIDGQGIARPAVNPLKHGQQEPLRDVSPEGESFILIMAAAWRDCVCLGICLPDA